MSEPSIVIRSSRLVVEVAQPGADYRGTRFDWTGYTTQVTLDGKHIFCVPESYTPGEGTNGSGLCNEFGIDMPIGYDDAQPGESFPKLGIGLLKRPDDQPYSFMRPHEIAESFPISVEATPTQVVFFVKPVACRGYAAHLTKTLTVEENTLTVAYRLENTGEKAVKTLEYAHNFMGIDKLPMGPDFRLQFPYEAKLENFARAMREAARGLTPRWMRSLLPGFVLDWLIASKMRGNNILVVKEREIGLSAAPTAPFYCRPMGFSQTSEPQFELLHKPSGVGMREYDDFAPVRVAVWGTAHVISAEIFNLVDVEPGQVQTWTRRYEFFG